MRKPILIIIVLCIILAIGVYFGLIEYYQSQEEAKLKAIAQPEYKVFSVDSFLVEYPDWIEIEIKNPEKVVPPEILENTEILLVLTDNIRAQVVISKRELTAEQKNLPFREIFPKMLGDNKEAYQKMEGVTKYQINKIRIENNQGYAEIETNQNNLKFTSFAKSVLITSSESLIYTISFNTLTRVVGAYQPIIDHIINSVKVVKE